MGADSLITSFPGAEGMSGSGAVSVRVEDTAEESADSAGPSAIEGVTEVD